MPVKPPVPGMAVLSGAGGAVALARGSFSIARLRSSIVSRNWRSGLAKPGASFASSAQLLDLVAPLAHGAVAHHGRLAERAQGRPRGLGERAEAGEEGVEVGCSGAQVAQQRGLLVGQLAEPGHRRASARRGSAAGAGSCARCRPCGWPRSRRRGRPRRPSALRPSCSLSSSATTVSESVMKFSITLFWSPRILSTLRSRAGPGARAGAPPGDPGAAPRGRCRAR